MSLGCALENLLIAARAAGHAPEVTYPDPTTDFIRVRLPADTVQTSPLIEVATIRSQFQQAIGLGNALPQLLIRFGYGKSMPQSLRRSVEQVLV